MTLVLVEAVKNINNVMEKTNETGISQYIEHTVLKVDTTEKDIKKLCTEAIKHDFYAVCVPPYYVKYARKFLSEKDIKIVTVVGFPFGYNTIIGKAEETKRVIESGADEIDMVMNIAAFKSGNYPHVSSDIRNVSTLCRLGNLVLKVIIETALLTEKEIKKACEICAAEEVDFVKTSTGFNGKGANVKDVKLMRSLLPPNIKIKASAGIKDYKTAIALIKAGADRIGTSSGVELVNVVSE